jgi:hypothetical protein
VSGIAAADRWAAAGLLALLLLAVSATPASADPAGPTHYRSTITGLQTADGADVTDEVGATFDVLGGDAFLVVHAGPGSEVEVPGYEGEPYVRIAADGTVEVNQRSPSRWVNDERYEATGVDMPGDVDVEAPPRWEVVASSGEYAWHDHRIHWMSPSLPRQVDPTAGTPQPVADWEVPVIIDGQALAVTGELIWQPGPPPIVPVAAFAVAALVGMAVAVTRPAWTVALVAVASVVTLGAGLAASVGLPAGADADLFLVVLPVLALLVLAGGLLVARRDPAGTTRGRLITGAAGVPLLVWAVLQVGAMTRPIVPGALPPAGLRVVVAVAVAAGVAGLVSALRGVLAVTSLDRAEASTPS